MKKNTLKALGMALVLFIYGYLISSVGHDHSQHGHNQQSDQHNNHTHSEH